MLFSNSPVKKVVEKLNPFSQKNKISRLKFERKSDYRTFLKFIKDNTKEIEDIKIPDPEDKKRKGLMIGGGLLGLALLASFGRGKGDSDDDNTGKLKSISGVIEKAKADSRKAASGGKDRRRLDQGDDVLDKTRSERSGKKEEEKTRRKIVKKLKKKIGQEKKVKDYLKRREQRKIIKQYANAGKVTSNVDPYIPKDKTKITAGNIFDPPDSNIKGKKITISGGFNIDEDAKIGFPSEKDIKGEKKLTKDIFKSDVKKITTPSSDDISGEKSILRNFNKKNQRLFMDVDGTFKTNYDDLSTEAKNMDSNTKKLNKILNQPGASRVNPYTRFNPTEPFMDDDLGQRTGKTTDKLELKPPKKLTQFDKFNRFSNRILNSPAAKFTTFMGGLLANPKFMIIKSLMEPTPLADGTLEGKPGVSAFSEQLMFDEDMAVNIFMPPEERESMIPFDANITPPPDTPTDLQAPSTNVFIDYEFNTSEDLFFIKMAGS
tara:strand:- start:15 stop:1481 length:1467 start_codon:yes stop_codon:yes gene_type:complete